MTEALYVGSPTRIELDTTIDLSTSSQWSIEAKRPDGTTTSWPATISGTKLIYSPVVSQWSMPGEWTLQGKFKMAGMTDPYYTDIISERVRAQFE